MAQLENHTHQVEQESELEVAVELTNAPDIEEERRTSTLTDLASLATQLPIHEGTVFKVGGKGGLERVQKRYFVLYEGVLVYYHHHTNYIRDKKHGLRDGKVVRLEGVYLSKPDSHPSRLKHCIVLHVPHKSNKKSELLVAFHHKKDKNMWVELLQTQNPDLRPSLSEEHGSEKRIPLYIQRMREIDFCNPQSRYHMSRFHSLPNTHQSLTSQDLEALRGRYRSHRIASLPTGHSKTLPTHHHLRVSTDHEIVSEEEEDPVLHV